MRVVTVPYAEARRSIRTGDLLLKRRRGWIGMDAMIAQAGRSPWCHAAMASWWGQTLMLLEMVQFVGGRAVTLSSQVRAAPGRWDWFSCAMDGGCGRGVPGFDRYEAAQNMLRMTGTPYGWRSLLRVALARAPITRWLMPPRTNDLANGAPKFCSDAISWACREAGCDPVPHLADGYTEPADLARSTLFTYRFTLEA